MKSRVVEDEDEDEDEKHHLSKFKLVTTEKKFILFLQRLKENKMKIRIF